MSLRRLVEHSRIGEDGLPVGALHPCKTCGHTKMWHVINPANGCCWQPTAEWRKANQGREYAGCTCTEYVPR